jgi:hypothetical protein
MIAVGRILALISIVSILPAISSTSNSQEKKLAPNITVTSNNQSGGITAYQVNIGQIYLSFSEEIAAELAAKLPKDRPVDIMGVGSPKDWQVADQYALFLQNGGYTIRNRNSAGMVTPPPDNPISITVYPDHSDVMIAPRA